MTGDQMKARLAEHCAKLPGATMDHPFGDDYDAWRVGGKMFAVIGAKAQGYSMKCADVDTAQMLIDAGVGQRAPYFHKSWIMLPPDTADDELRHRLRLSYGTIRAGLTRKSQAALPPWEA